MLGLIKLVNNLSVIYLKFLSESMLVFFESPFLGKTLQTSQNLKLPNTHALIMGTSMIVEVLISRLDTQENTKRTP